MRHIFFLFSFGYGLCLLESASQSYIRFIQITLQTMYSQQQNRSYYAQPDPRNPYNQPPRPQTPHSPVLSNLPSYNLNKSYGRLPSQVPSYPNPIGAMGQKNNFSRSRVSMASSHVSQLNNMMSEHTDIFPDDLVFLLSNEEKNINNLKEKVEREKAKVENDFAVFRTQIDHILEDVKISVQAELDLIYKAYITKYAEIKGEVQELRLMRREILMNNQTGMSNGFGGASVSNKDLISEIEKDAEQMRNYKIYGYLGELQKQKLEPIVELSDELIFIGAAECGFYRQKELSEKLKDVKHHFGSFIKEVFDNLADYIVTPQRLVEREKEEQDNARGILKEFDIAEESKSRQFDPHYVVNSRLQEMKATRDPRVEQLRGSKQIKSIKKTKLRVNPNQQGCLVKWCEELKLNRLERVETDHNDSILCIHFLNDQYVATGSKDATINIYSLDGKKIRKLKGHEASICCLSSVKNLNGETFLASGSDHGCSSLVLWDIRSWGMTSKVQAHSAAVTGILDLEDGRHIATGSYDKKINIFSMQKNQIILSLNNNRTSVTGMIMNADRSKLITSGLDKTVSVWSILRRNGTVEEVVHDKVIYVNELVCQLQPSALRPELIFCAIRDGSLKLINLISEKEEKSLSVSSNSLIELVVIEREMSADGPILLTCSSKDNSLIVARMDSGMHSLLKLPTNLGIDYGCGIGPKIVLSSYSSGVMAIVNQRSSNREFTLYQLDLK